MKEITKMNKQEINETIAKWCGFKHNPLAKQDPLCGHWLEPDGRPRYMLPDFTTDLNALFKYAVPKWIGKIMTEQECSSDLAYAILFKKWLQELELNIPHATMALCKALLMLIGK